MNYYHKNHLINQNLLLIKQAKGFQDLIKVVTTFKKQNPQLKVISLGVGDVSFPIVSPVIKAMHQAVNDLSKGDTFKGYGAYYGYDFLKKQILTHEYQGLNFTNQELYISSGTKTDVTDILELFSPQVKIGIPSISYPIYKYGALCLNRSFELIPGDSKSSVPNRKYDLLYLNSPNNPLGIAYSYQELKEWVNYAQQNNCIILYDNVYFSFITSSDKPKSIYEIKGAKEVAIEFRSFSKSISFTGVRCSYYVIPKELNVQINDWWRLRTFNRFNGADYIAQRGAAASYLPAAQNLIRFNIKSYLMRAQLLRQAFLRLGFEVIGGIDSPYLWIKTKGGLKSEAFFELMLRELHLVVIPGIIFGVAGDDYFRVSALGKEEDIKIAIKRLEDYYA